MRHREGYLRSGRERVLCDHWKKCGLYPERPWWCAECIYPWKYARKKYSRITRLYNVEEKEAVKMMADTDKRRMTNYNFYTDQRWGKADNYTLCLNSSQLGYDRWRENNYGMYLICLDKGWKIKILTFLKKLKYNLYYKTKYNLHENQGSFHSNYWVKDPFFYVMYL